MQHLCTSGFFYDALQCPTCDDEMHGNPLTRRFRCRRRACKTGLSLRSHTFFSGSRLKCCQIMHMAYHCLNKDGQSQSVNATGCSKKTVTVFYAHFRSLVATTLEEEDTIIGESNIEVEVDETKLGKQKYNPGHRADGV
jgi:hypothetical protein